MIDVLLRGFWLSLVRLFYRQIGVSGTPPTDGPVILVANHPNGLLDPLVMRLGVSRPVAFLGKSTLFAIPVLRRMLLAFGGIPVYRAKEADTTKNEETFSRCRELLRRGGWLALFPEGISHDEPELQPLKTGAARIALSADVPGLRVVPVGLLYEDKEIFRSRAALAFGPPVEVPAGTGATPEAVRALTENIATALAQVVLQAEDAEIWRGLVAVAAWTADDGGRDVAALDARARRLSAAYRSLCARDPERVAELVDATRRFARELESVGVTNPFALEAPAVNPIRAVLPLLLLAPIALVGALLGWVPYRLVRPLSARLAKGHADVIGTFKVLLGTFLIPGAWLAEAIAVGLAWGPIPGVAVFLLGPLTGMVALRWGERLDLRREALRAGWLVTNRERIAKAVAERRRALAEAVEAGLAAAG